MNFGLHDYNLGLAGVDEYTTELTESVRRTKAVLSGARLLFVGTTPAHNTATPADDVSGPTRGTRGSFWPLAG